MRACGIHRFLRSGVRAAACNCIVRLSSRATLRLRHVHREAVPSPRPEGCASPARRNDSSAQERRKFVVQSSTATGAKGSEESFEEACQKPHFSFVAEKCTAN